MKWETELKKFSLIQRRRRHGKGKESGNRVQLNLRSRLSKTIYAMSVDHDKTKHERTGGGWGSADLATRQVAQPVRLWLQSTQLRSLLKRKGGGEG